MSFVFSRACRNQQEARGGKDGNRPPERAGLRERLLSGRIDRRRHRRSLRRLLRRVRHEEGPRFLRNRDGVALRRQLDNAPDNRQPAFPQARAMPRCPARQAELDRS